MARDLDTIKSELKTDNPTLKSGDRVFEEEEYNKTINAWAEEIRATELNNESNGWLYNRQAEYPSIQDCIHALLDGGDTLTDLQAARQVVKDKYPKP
tara:strand:+ start:1553 stop:1843 length:291 start_codon:yes stop_codon:yes gene_type:complete